MEETGNELADERPASRIDYAELVAGIPDHAQTGVEWVGVPKGRAAEQREAEAVHIASWILDSVGRVEIRDPDTGELRPLAFRDVALLYRARTGLTHMEDGAQALRHPPLRLRHDASRPAPGDPRCAQRAAAAPERAGRRARLRLPALALRRAPGRDDRPHPHAPARRPSPPPGEAVAGGRGVAGSSRSPATDPD